MKRYRRPDVDKIPNTLDNPITYSIEGHADDFRKRNGPDDQFAWSPNMDSSFGKKKSDEINLKFKLRDRFELTMLLMHNFNVDGIQFPSSV